MKRVQDHEIGDATRPRAFFVFNRELGTEMLGQLAREMVQPGDAVITTDGTGHCYGRDALNVFEADDVAVEPVGFSLLGVPHIGRALAHGEKPTHFIMVELSSVTLALVNWQAMPPEVAAAGLVGLLWNLHGTPCKALQRMRDRLVEATPDPLGFRKLLGGGT